MQRWSAGRLLLTVAAGAALWAGVAALCLMAGSTGAFGWPSRDVFPFRLQPVLIASLVGAALAAAGVAYQAILRNPLADPYLLGVSSGASLFAYLWRFAAMGALAAALSQQAFAFAGAGLAVVVVFVLASSRGRIEPVTLLLVGVIVNAVNASVFLLINAISRDSPGTGGPLVFLVGGINANNVTDEQLIVVAAIVGAGWIALMTISGQLNVAALSESEAEALGVNIHRLRWIALGVASLMTASAVALTGPIGFVGLVCPHLARLIVGRDVRRLLPLATALGAALLAAADALSRHLVPAPAIGTKLPVGVLTGLTGGPFFLLLLWQARRKGASR